MCLTFVPSYRNVSFMPFSLSFVPFGGSQLELRLFVVSAMGVTWAACRRHFEIPQCCSSRRAAERFSKIAHNAIIRHQFGVSLRLFECLPTPSLSEKCSNQLSYWPGHPGFLLVSLASIFSSIRKFESMGNPAS